MGGFADLSDVSLREYQETMQRPFFSLSKSKRIKPIEYESPDGKVSVTVSANPLYGMATIWDADILIFLASVVQDQIRSRRNELSPVVHVNAGQLLRRIGRTVAGSDYERLVAALTRLQSTTIRTNIRAGNRRETVFSWIDSFSHLVDEKTGKALGMEITMSKWFFDGVKDSANVLSINPDYFKISGGLERVLYRIGRKHAGGHGRDGFTIGLTTLHEKTGSEASFKRFKHELIKIVERNALPDIHLSLRNMETNPQIRFVMRDQLDGDDALPSPAKASAPARKPRTASEHKYSRFAEDEISPEILAQIRAECPGWDLDERKQAFDRLIKRNPAVLPANYDRRFLAFMRTHHERNKHNLSLFS